MRKMIEVGGGKISLGNDYWLHIEDDEGKRISVWLAQDDLAAMADFFKTFAALSLLQDDS